MRKKSWVNPNPTRCNHAGCQINQQSLKDKAKYLASTKMKVT